MTRRLLLASASLVLPLLGAGPLHAQQPAGPPATTATPPSADAAPDAAPDPAAEEEGEDTITVIGQKPRGSVAGDIPPEAVLSARDIRATGATSISDLLDALAPQLGSARGAAGGRPVLLLNGKRISGFRELRDLPPEAIERMDILPEEVALRYGYAADQKVANIVLRRRFHSTSAELGGKVATAGGWSSGQLTAGRLDLGANGRRSLTLRLDGSSPLYEDERPLSAAPLASLPDPLDPRPYRTLNGESRTARLTGAFDRALGDDFSLTLSPELEWTRAGSALGPATAILTPPGGPALLRAFPDDGLRRQSTSRAGRLGLALNGNRGGWTLSLTGDSELATSRSRADRGPDVAALQAALDDGTATFDPLGDLGPLTALPDDRSRSTRTSGNLLGTASGPLARLPAGAATLTAKLGASALAIDSRSTRRGLETRSDLDRVVEIAGASLDVPLLKRSSPIGRLGANFNADVQHLSDFGVLAGYGAGLTWAPANDLSLIASWTRSEGAPTLQALGDPLVETPLVPYFDATAGRSVLVTTLTGGNPDLAADRRSVWKLGANWQPIRDKDLRLRADLVHEVVKNPQLGFPAASPALEAAFPDRFQRDPDGNLLRVDLRPVSAEASHRSTLRFGFDWSKPLKSAAPSPAAIAALRQRFQGDNPNPQRPAGRFFGGNRNGGRLTFSLTDTLTFRDDLVIASTLPKLDYLDGAARGSTGGRPRHAVEAQAGWANNGFGARLGATWQSATRVDGLSDADDLRFASYGTVNLRLFANPGQNLAWVAKYPVLRGTSLRFEINNLFDARPRVTTATGAIPSAYDPYRLEPVGRTIGLSLRKLFIPRRFLQRGGAGRGNAAPTPGGEGASPPPPPAS